MASTEVKFLAAMNNVKFDKEGAGKVTFDVSARDSVKLAQIAHMHDVLLEVTVKIADESAAT